MHDRGVDDDNNVPVEQPLAMQEDAMDAPAVNFKLTRMQANNVTSAVANDPAVDRGINKDNSCSQYEEGFGFGAGLYDARNAFG